MHVIEADTMGMCFGVRDALALARNIETPAAITLFGQLVHNPDVAGELAARGFAVLEENQRAATHVHTPAVLITAHGISDRDRHKLLAAGKSLHDATCPLVKKAHAAALSLARQEFFVVIVGKPGHVEIAGLTGDLEPGRFAVIERPDEISPFDSPKIAVMAQTTTCERDLFAVWQRIQQTHAGEVRLVNTVCQPTRDRQSALETLARQATVLVVVGGKQSNNTRELARRGRELGRRVIHIEHAGELRPEMFSAGDIVGLTAGTSVPDEIIAAVREKLSGFANAAQRPEGPAHVVSVAVRPRSAIRAAISRGPTGRHVCDAAKSAGPSGLAQVQAPNSVASRPRQP